MTTAAGRADIEHEPHLFPCSLTFGRTLMTHMRFLTLMTPTQHRSIPASDVCSPRPTPPVHAAPQRVGHADVAVHAKASVYPHPFTCIPTTARKSERATEADDHMSVTLEIPNCHRLLRNTPSPHRPHVVSSTKPPVPVGWVDHNTGSINTFSMSSYNRL